MRYKEGKLLPSDESHWGSSACVHRSALHKTLPRCASIKIVQTQKNCTYITL